jgi:hypothetical protein
MDIETITPAKARQYLATRATNRVISEAAVIEYAMLMDQDRWVLNGSTIVFDADGHLIDGQHRLSACDLANKSFETYVVRGVEDTKAMATIDTGRVRSHTDVWTIAGRKHASLTSTIAIMTFLHERGRIGWHGVISERIPRGSGLAAKLKAMPTRRSIVAKDQLLAYGEPLMSELVEAARAVERSKAGKIFGVQPVGALYFFAARKGKAAAEQFLIDIGSGVGLNIGDPALAVREHVITRKVKAGAKLNRGYIFGMLIKAWNARRDGREVKVLRVGEGEPFPKVK